MKYNNYNNYATEESTKSMKNLYEATSLSFQSRGPHMQCTEERMRRGIPRWN